jgi:hypothetical protein
VAGPIYDLPDGWVIDAVFAPEIAAEYAACPPGVSEGWTYAGGVFSPPVQPVLTKQQLIAYANIKQWGAGNGRFYRDSSRNTSNICDGQHQPRVDNRESRQVWTNEPANLS